MASKKGPSGLPVFLKTAVGQGPKKGSAHKGAVAQVKKAAGRPARSNPKPQAGTVRAAKMKAVQTAAAKKRKST